MRTVMVVPEGAAPYDVRIGRGLIGRLGAEIAPLLARPRTLVVADEAVARLYGAAALASLRKAAIDAEIVTVPPGEGSKTFAELERLCDAMAGAGLDRKDAIIALGGGVVGDLAGFAAAIYMRGIGVVQVPTTLLSQVDSSVGGKTAIDTPRGKNLVGAFWQPRLVLADVDVLDTLPERELRAGWAEVLKYGLIGDAELFERLAASGPLDRAGREAAVAASVEAKAKIVAEDTRESGRRALLNLGHTFGHALEAESGFGDALLHGEAVGLGMTLAFRFSADQGLCPRADADRASAAVAAAGLPTGLAQAPGGPYSAAALIKRMAHDKKSEGGRLTLVLARRIGDAFVARDVDPDALAMFLVKEGARP